MSTNVLVRDSQHMRYQPVRCVHDSVTEQMNELLKVSRIRSLPMRYSDRARILDIALYFVSYYDMLISLLRTCYRSMIWRWQHGVLQAS